MKRMIFLQTVLLSLLTSCAGFLIPEYGHYYAADNAKKNKCEPIMLDKSIIQEMFKKENYTPEGMAKWEDQSGYSECISESNFTDSGKYECKKPVPYISFFTSKQALCHKFMVENKLMEHTTK